VCGNFVDSVENREKARVDGLGFERHRNLDEILREAIRIRAPRKARGLVWDDDLPTALASPLFYDQSLVFVCPHCDLVRDLGLLEWMAENDLIIPVLGGCYHAFTKETVAVLARIKHISPFAFFEVEQAWANKEGLGCLCSACTKKELADYSKLPTEARRLVESFYIGRLTELPTRIRATVIPQVNASIAAGDMRALEDLTDTIDSMVILSRARSIGAIPQFRFSKEPKRRVSSAEESKLLALSLGIGYSSKIRPREYLEVIADFKGALGFLVKDDSPNSLSRALDKVEQINTEIRGIRASRRYKLYQLGTRLLRRNRRVAIEAIVGGAFGLLATGPVGAAVGAGTVLAAETAAKDAATQAVSRVSKGPVALSAAAHFFGKSLEAVQVWRLQESIRTRSAR